MSTFRPEVIQSRISNLSFSQDRMDRNVDRDRNRDGGGYRPRSVPGNRGPAPQFMWMNKRKTRKIIKKIKNLSERMHVRKQTNNILTHEHK